MGDDDGRESREPLTGEQKDAILSEARALRSEAKAKAREVIRSKKSAALGIALPKGPTAKAPAALGTATAAAKPRSAAGALPAVKAKPLVVATATPSSLPAHVGKKSAKPAKAAGAKTKGKHPSARVEGTSAEDEPAAPPALTSEEREAQRAAAARARDELRVEMERAIVEEEERIRATETAARKREAARRALEAKLLEAAFDGELEPIRAQVAEWQAACASTLIGERLAFADANGHTMLSEAAVAGRADVARLLLSAGANPNARNGQGRTPLWRAAFQGHAETARLLLTHGADPRIASTDSETPVMVASAPAIRRELAEWDLARTDALLAEAASAPQWKPPPPDARDPGVPSGQSGQSAQILIRRLPDVLEAVTLRGERYVLVVDLSGKALIFLQYRDVNLLNYCRPADVTPEAVRRALVGALRYGKPLVLDLTLMADVTLGMLDELFEPVLPGGGLCAALLDRRVLQPAVYERLLAVAELDAQSDLRLSQWAERTTANFCFCVVTRNPIVSDEVAERFFVLKCA